MPSRPVPADIEISFKGLAQKYDEKNQPPAALARATNVEFDKEGELNKRLGYFRVSFFTDMVLLGEPDLTAMHLAKRRGELLVITHDRVLGLASAAADMRGSDAFVYRGPCNRGAIRGEFVSVSRLGSDHPEGGDVG